MRIRITPEQLEDCARQTKVVYEQLQNTSKKLKQSLDQVLERSKGNSAIRIKGYLDNNFVINSGKAVQTLIKIEKDLNNIAQAFRLIDATNPNSGPENLKQLQASMEECWLLSGFAYINNPSNNYLNNIQNALKQGEPIESINALNIGLENAEWKVMTSVDDPKTGYQGVAMINQKTGEVVISHRGTEFKRQPLLDGLADGINVIGNIKSFQIDSAQKFTDEIKSLTGDTKIIHTGHSLGGYISQDMAVKNNHVAVTFNSPGYDDSPSPVQKDYSNQIRNYTIDGDPVAGTNKHLKGTEIELPSKGFMFGNHYHENFGDTFRTEKEATKKSGAVKSD